MTKTYGYVRFFELSESFNHNLRDFEILPEEVVTEIAPITIKAAARPKFKALLGKLNRGDRLVVDNIDSLGKNLADVLATIEIIRRKDSELYCATFGPVNFLGEVGSLIISTLQAVLEFESRRLSERTLEGHEAARQLNTHLGRKPTPLSPDVMQKINLKLLEGRPITVIARELGLTRSIISYYRDKRRKSS